MVKNLPAKQEMWIRSLAWEDHLEKGMAIHSSILAWDIPQTEEPGGLQSMGSQKNYIRYFGLLNLRIDSEVVCCLIAKSCPTLLRPHGL